MCTSSRTKLTTLQMSKSIRAVMTAKPDWTVKRISKEIGLSTSYVYRILKLTKGMNNGESV